MEHGLHTEVLNSCLQLIGCLGRRFWVGCGVGKELEVSTCEHALGCWLLVGGSEKDPWGGGTDKALELPPVHL